MALQAVARVAHRGAASTDNSGDGAGHADPDPAAALPSRGLPPRAPARSPASPSAVGVFFLPAGPRAAGPRRAAGREGPGAERHSLPRLARRARRPGGPGAAGPRPAAPPSGRSSWAARSTAPDDDAWERALYLARRDMERRGGGAGISPFFVCSFSCRTIVYKALLHRAPSCRRSTPTSAIPSTRARSRSSTSATPPTPCRAGRWRSRSG